MPASDKSTFRQWRDGIRRLPSVTPGGVDASSIATKLARIAPGQLYVMTFNDCARRACAVAGHSSIPCHLRLTLCNENGRSANAQRACATTRHVWIALIDSHCWSSQKTPDPAAGATFCVAHNGVCSYLKPTANAAEVASLRAFRLVRVTLVLL